MKGFISIASSKVFVRLAFLMLVATISGTSQSKGKDCRELRSSKGQQAIAGHTKIKNIEINVTQKRELIKMIETTGAMSKNCHLLEIEQLKTLIGKNYAIEDVYVTEEERATSTIFNTFLTTPLAKNVGHGELVIYENTEYFRYMFQKRLSNDTLLTMVKYNKKIFESTARFKTSTPRQPTATQKVESFTNPWKAHLVKALICAKIFFFAYLPVCSILFALVWYCLQIMTFFWDFFYETRIGLLNAESHCNRTSQVTLKATLEANGAQIWVNERNKHFDAADCEQDTCVICLDTIELEQSLCKLTCNHLFHCDCILRCFSKFYSRCPICRQPALTQLHKSTD
ncbi:uncharacterized protein LOC143446091 isoform X2 [Clavelina lepadiformis]|uniref:uncharacterized protein LOC143446091 isoform X2 n=2 Tax=Clavelina lepadiformis TaxID=159417 RepID=UPI00404206DA